MTILAWDGTMLAADKRSINSGLIRTTRKIHGVNGAIVGFSGNSGNGAELLEWVRQGCDPTTYPASQRDKDEWDVLVIIDAKGLRTYEKTPYPIYYEDKFWATGSGRDFAMAAMYLGCDARKAVEVACVFENGCGNGIDAMVLSV